MNKRTKKKLSQRNGFKTYKEYCLWKIKQECLKTIEEFESTYGITDQMNIPVITLTKKGNKLLKLQLLQNCRLALPKEIEENESKNNVEINFNCSKFDLHSEYYSKPIKEMVDFCRNEYLKGTEDSQPGTKNYIEELRAKPDIIIRKDIKEQVIPSPLSELKNGRVYTDEVIDKIRKQMEEVKNRIGENEEP